MSMLFSEVQLLKTDFSIYSKDSAVVNNPINTTLKQCVAGSLNKCVAIVPAVELVVVSVDAYVF